MPRGNLQMKLYFVLWALSSATPSYLYVADAVEVTRVAEGKPDSFTFTNLDEISQPSDETCAASSGFTSVPGSCRNDTALCSCTCDVKTPTFITYLGKCVEDKEVRGLFDKSPTFSVEQYNGTFNIHPCPPRDLPTIDIRKSGSRQKLALCEGNNRTIINIKPCALTDVYYLYESTIGTFVEETEQGKTVFKFRVQNRYPSLKWSNRGSKSPLIGAIALINFACGEKKQSYYGRLLVKISGSKQWDLPSVKASATTMSRSVSEVMFFGNTTQSTAAITRSLVSTDEITPSTETSTEHSKTITATASSTLYLAATTTVALLPWLPDTASMVTTSEFETTTTGTHITSSYSFSASNTKHSVTTTGLTKTDYLTIQSTAHTTAHAATSTIKGKMAEKRGTRAAGNELSVTIALSVVGGLGFVIVICVSVSLLTRKRRKSERDAAKKGNELNNSINPIYERGVDNIMMSENVNAAYTEKLDSTYQPIVQNTRAASSDQPTYESLQREKHREPAKDPSIYQALDTSKPQEIKTEDYYQPLFKQSRALHKDRENQDDNRDTGQDYVVLEDPCDNTNGTKDPVYQVLEQGEGEGPPQENHTPDEPVYNVVEAE